MPGGGNDFPKMAAAILLLGPPGVGKSRFGEWFRDRDATHRTFLNVGEKLREASGLVEDQLTLPTESKMTQLRVMASDLIREECKRHALLSEKSSERLLILECVKEVEDADTVLTVLQEEGIQLVQSLLILNQIGFLTIERFGGGSSARRDDERMVSRRQDKWERNASRLIEIFSSFENMSEVFEETPRSRKADIKSLSSLGYGSQAGLHEKLFHGFEDIKHSSLCFKSVSYVVSPRIVTIRGEKKRILSDFSHCSGISLLGPGPSPMRALPVPRPLSNSEDVKWIAYPSRYLVSRKCDGSRHLLFVDREGKPYLLNRAGMIYSYPIHTHLPAGTVLDGELLWKGGKGFFLAFDAVAIGSVRTWHLTLEERLQRMEQDLNLVEAERSDGLNESDAASRAADADDILATTQNLTLHDQDSSGWPKVRIFVKQRAPPPGLDTITVLRKKHIAVSPKALASLEDTRASCPYPTDGLVFTPCVMPWGLKMGELLYKWQAAQDQAADIAGQDLKWITDVYEPTQGRHQSPQDSRGRAASTLPTPPFFVPSGLVCECLASNLKDVRKPWVLSHRLGYAGAQGSRGRGGEDRLILASRVDIVNSEQNSEPLKEIAVKSVSVRWDKVHGASPLDMLDFSNRLDQQFSHNELIADVERFSSPSLCPGPASSLSFLHPESSLGVRHPARALPFQNLYTLIMAQVVAGTVERTVDADTGLEVFNARASCTGLVRDVCRGLVCHPKSNTLVATPFLSFPREPPKPPNAWHSPEVHASLKVDGTMATVFLWCGRVQVATRRRMDSEQAKWAQRWLEHNESEFGMLPSWTYIFEMVSDSNQVVVHYPFEGLVLLGAVSPDGKFALPEDCRAIAGRLGVVQAPFITGQLHNLQHFLPKLQGHGYPSSEGWVLTMPDGSLSKLVHPSYSQAKLCGRFLHPVIIWDQVRLGRSASVVAADFRYHFRRELFLILESLQRRYTLVRDLLIRVAGMVDAEHNKTATARVDRFRLPAKMVREDEWETAVESATISLEAFTFLVDECSRKAPEALEGNATGSPESMFYDGSATARRHQPWRCLILSCIKPGQDGSLKGYTPSENFKQTFAKGWKEGPPEQRYNPMRDEVVLLPILHEIVGVPMVRSLAVCQQWRSLLKAAPDFAQKLQTAREDVAAASRIAAELRLADDRVRLEQDQERRRQSARRFASHRDFNAYGRRGYYGGSDGEDDHDSDTDSFWGMW